MSLLWLKVAKGEAQGLKLAEKGFLSGWCWCWQGRGLGQPWGSQQSDMWGPGPPWPCPPQGSRPLTFGPGSHCDLRRHANGGGEWGGLLWAVPLRGARVMYCPTHWPLLPPRRGPQNAGSSERARDGRLKTAPAPPFKTTVAAWCLVMPMTIIMRTEGWPTIHMLRSLFNPLDNPVTWALFILSIPSLQMGKLRPREFK